jgi:hypothetical protein
VAEVVLQEVPCDKAEGGGLGVSEERAKARKEVKESVQYAAIVALVVTLGGWKSAPSPFIALISGLIFFGMTLWAGIVLTNIKLIGT